MWPDRVSNPGPLTYESGALPEYESNPAIKNQIINELKRYSIFDV